jgi:hypothetical protein
VSALGDNETGDEVHATAHADANTRRRQQAQTGNKG